MAWFISVGCIFCPCLIFLSKYKSEKTIVREPIRSDSIHSRKAKSQIGNNKSAVVVIAVVFNY